MMVWKMIFLFQDGILRFHVKFQGCIGISMGDFITDKQKFKGRNNNPTTLPEKRKANYPWKSMGFSC